MKLSKEFKDRIDQYFENVSAEDLFNISTIKYGFQEDTSFVLTDQPFTLSDLDVYSSLTNEEGCFTTAEESTLSLAA